MSDKATEEMIKATIEMMIEAWADYHTIYQSENYIKFMQTNAHALREYLVATDKWKKE